MSTSDLYLRLLEDNLLGLHTKVTYRTLGPRFSALDRAVSLVGRALGRDLHLMVKTGELNTDVREQGDDWPIVGETMIGRRRLHNIRQCVETVVSECVQGDLVEAGVWRGGAGIYMRALLETLGDSERLVWMADSFEGLPPPSIGGAPEDEGNNWWELTPLKVSLEEVEDNFRKYGLLDDRVRFLKGWFEHTLARSTIGRIAVLRADGDMYSSTWSTLTALEPRVSSGGFIIIDDYNGIGQAKMAVDRYRDQHSISAELVRIDWTGVYWRKD